MWREIRHTITGPGQVCSEFDGLRIRSDHPDPTDQEDRPPPPWFQFLASVGACVTSFVAGALRELGIDPAGITIVQRQEYAENDDVIPAFSFVIRLPEGLSARDRDAVLAAARQCSVKRAIEAAPDFSFKLA